MPVALVCETIVKLLLQVSSDLETYVDPPSIDLDRSVASSHVTIEIKIHTETLCKHQPPVPCLELLVNDIDTTMQAPTCHRRRGVVVSIPLTVISDTDENVTALV